MPGIVIVSSFDPSNVLLYITSIPTPTPTKKDHEIFICIWLTIIYFRYILWGWVGSSPKLTWAPTRACIDLRLMMWMVGYGHRVECVDHWYSWTRRRSNKICLNGARLESGIFSSVCWLYLLSGRRSCVRGCMGYPTQLTVRTRE